MTVQCTNNKSDEIVSKDRFSEYLETRIYKLTISLHAFCIEADTLKCSTRLLSQSSISSENQNQEHEHQTQYTCKGLFWLLVSLTLKPAIISFHGCFNSKTRDNFYSQLVSLTLKPVILSTHLLMASLTLKPAILSFHCFFFFFLLPGMPLACRAATKVLHFCLSLAIFSIVPQELFIDFSSHPTVRLHVFFGLRRLHFPSGVQCSAVLVMEF